jgi:hypothetical protein
MKFETYRRWPFDIKFVKCKCILFTLPKKTGFRLQTVVKYEKKHDMLFISVFIIIYIQAIRLLQNQ